MLCSRTIKLFSLYVVRVDTKCDFRLTVNPTNGGEYKGHAMTDTHNFDTIYIYSPDRLRQCQGALHTLCRSTSFY